MMKGDTLSSCRGQSQAVNIISLTWPGKPEAGVSFGSGQNDGVLAYKTLQLYWVLTKYQCFNSDTANAFNVRCHWNLMENGHL